MKLPLAAAAAAAAAAATLFAPLSQATVINSVYTPLGGSTWLVDFTLVFDGSPSSITNFTVDFPSFSNLVLVASPATWDTLLVQPDAGIPDPGYLDSLALTPAAALTAGSLGGFQVQFTFAGTPGPLPFVISDATFTPVFAGVTTVVPEPAAWLMFALGLAGMAVRRGMRHEEAAA